MFTEEFYSSLVPADLLKRLQSSTALEIIWSNPFSSKPKKLFQGTIGTNSFSVQRIISYRNSMLPRLEAEVLPHPDALGSLLIVKYRASVVVVIFAVVWLGLTGTMMLGALIESIKFDAFTSPMVSTSSLFLVGLAVFIIPFWLEVRKARTVLTQLLSLRATPLA